MGAAFSSEFFTHMRTYLARIAAIIILLPSNSFAQFKHDIGLKLSTNEYERLHVEYRWHANENWALTATFVYGERFDFYSFTDPEVGDSTIEIFTNSGQTKAFNLSLGVIRKLTFMKHNYYYVGGNLGAGQTREWHTESRGLYFLDSTALTYGVYQAGEAIEDSELYFGRDLFSMVTKLYLGADVPILDRLTLNMECGIGSNLSVYPNASLYFTSRVYAAAGLRYRFGRDLKE